MNQKLMKQLIISVLILLLSVIAIFGLLDQKSEEFTGEAFKRALITFGIARGLNGVISVAQGTEVALHPAGFGVNFTPGQILDPINDLVEQFSWVMLASSASLGIQKVLLTISSTLIVTLLLIVSLSALLVSTWRVNLFNPQLVRFINYTTIILIFIRFSVPVAALASEGMYQLFLQDQFVESSTSLEKTKNEISNINAKERESYDTKEEGIVDMAKRILSSTSESISVNTQIEKYQGIAAETTRHAINIIVVFVLQTILMPILFLWLTYRALKLAWARILPT